MSFVVEPPVEDYAVAASSPHPLDELFERLAAETRERMSTPQMMVGPLEGRFLELLVRLTRARRVLELGTFTGWSSIAMASALEPGLETMRTLEGPLDLVFIDADKEGYVDYYEAALPLLADEGLIVADNVLWSGRVAEDDPDERTRTIMAFNDHVRNDERVVAVMLTVRDGMTLIRKR